MVSTMDCGWRYCLVVARVRSSLVSYCFLVFEGVCHGVCLECLGGSSLSLSGVLGNVLGQRGSRGWVSGRESRRVA
jgi:hypothetical protein